MLAEYDLLQTDFLGNSWERWAVAGCLFLGVLFLTLALRALVVSRLEKISVRTESKLDDLALILLRKTHIVFFILVSLHIAVGSLHLPPKAGKVLSFAFFLVIFTQLGLWANRAIQFLGNSYVERTINTDAGKATTVRAMLFFGQVFVWITVALLLLDNWGVKVGPFIAGLGIGGIAIAFAVQGILADLFASLSIVLDKPFVIGDTIAVGSEVSTVEYIGLKTTRLKRNTGEQLIFSNSELLKSSIRNFKRMWERRALMRIGVLYETDIKKLEAMPGWLKNAVESVEGLRFGRAHLATFGGSAIEFEIEYWINKPDYETFMDTQQVLSLAILRKFQAEQIEFAYPTQKVFVENLSHARP